MAAAAEVSVGAALGGVGGGVDIARGAGPDTAGAAESDSSGTGNPGAGTGAEGAGTARNENGLQALTEREKTNLSSGSRNKVISTFQGAVDFVKTALSNRQSVDRAYFRKILDQVARMIRENAGINVSNYGVMLNGNDVRHIIREHGDPIAETARGQAAVTTDNIVKISEILSAPDRVYLSNETDGKDRMALVFEEQIGD